jgi:thiamine-monophosphate kinase
LNEKISVIGYITEQEKGVNIITKGGNLHPVTAQGWNAFKGENLSQDITIIHCK